MFFWQESLKHLFQFSHSLFPLTAKQTFLPFCVQWSDTDHRLARTIVLSRNYSIILRAIEGRGKRTPKVGLLLSFFYFTCDHHINGIFSTTWGFALENVGIFIACVIDTNSELPISIRVIHDPTYGKGSQIVNFNDLSTFRTFRCPEYQEFKT